VDLLILVLVLCIVGFAVWLLTTQVPMPPLWARAIQLFALIVMLIYVLTRVVHVPNVLK